MVVQTSAPKNVYFAEGNLGPRGSQTLIGITRLIGIFMGNNRIFSLVVNLTTFSIIPPSHIAYGTVRKIENPTILATTIR